MPPETTPPETDTQASRFNFEALARGELVIGETIPDVSVQEAIEWAAVLIDTHERKLEQLRSACVMCGNATAFYDRTLAASDAERVAVGMDHRDWVLRACREAGEAARND